jgi:hypothetical protein
MHELQDYFSHYAKGYRAPWGHLRDRTRPDDPRLPENDRGVKMADQITREMEALWRKKNPDYRPSRPHSDKRCLDDLLKGYSAPDPTDLHRIERNG